MKKILFALMTAAAIMAMSCSKNDEDGTNTGTNTPTGTNPPTETSIIGRWEAPRFPETPEDIAFVAIFGEQDLDLYVIAWGQHMKGTYTWSNNVVRYNITEAYNAYTNVSYDADSNMIGWEWNAGNLDAATLTLSNGYDWYLMTEDDLTRAKEDFGEFNFNVNGNTATSSLVGIENLTFNKKVN